MSQYNIISLSISILAFIFSIISFLRYKALSYGQLEIQISTRISQTKQRVEDLTIQFLPMLTKDSPTDEEKSTISAYKKLMDSSIEENLNAYEEICLMYINNKVDKASFKRTYKFEIRRLVEDENLRKYFDRADTKYINILKVYKAWEHKE